MKDKLTWKEKFLLKEYKIDIKTCKKTKSFRDTTTINGKTYRVQSNAVYALHTKNRSKK